MIGTSSAYYNYSSSVNSLYKYNYNKMTSQFSPYNTAGVTSDREKKNYVNNDAIEYLQSIREGAREVQGSLDSLKNGSAFTLMVESSNNDSLAVNASSRPTSAYSDTSVTVDQVATGQVNEGGAMNASDKYGSSGYQQFEIEINGTGHQFFVDVTSGDTNQSVQQKMADAINKKDIGVTASVSQEDGSSSLTVQSKNTGDDANNRFTISDVSGSLVADTGVGKVTQQAQNAVYRINGGETQTSKTNNIDLGNGVSVTLKQASSDPVTVSASRNTEYPADQVRDMVDSLNKLMDSAKNNAGTNDRLYRELNGAVRSYSSSLERIGVSMDKDGKLAVDGDKLAKAAENGSLERFFKPEGVSSNGFAGRISSITRGVESNPANYVVASTSNKSSFASYLNSDWSGVVSNGYSRSYNSALYNSYQNTGYLLNLFV